VTPGCSSTTGRRFGLEVIEAHDEDESPRGARIADELRVQASVPFKIDTGAVLLARRRTLDDTARLVAEFARDVLSGSERFSQALAERRGILLDGCSELGAERVSQAVPRLRPRRDIRKRIDRQLRIAISANRETHERHELAASS
jgi:hypothetical protein